MNKPSQNKPIPKVLMGVFSIVFITAIFAFVVTGIVGPKGAADPVAGDHGHMHW